MDFIYFALIYSWLTEKIDTFGSSLVVRSMQFATSIALALLTVWIIVQGFRILTGRSRESMMGMVSDMGRAAVIVAVATVMAIGSLDLQQFFGEDLARNINSLVTGSNESPSSNIDRNLAYTQLAMGAIEAISVPAGDAAGSNAQSRASLIAMLGVAGPPMTAGAMLLMYKVAMALFIGLGPLFILCLIFEQTKSMFHRWLMYGLATLFSLAVLNFMVSIVLELTLRVAAAMWASTAINAITGANAEGFTNQALQQGGIGLLMTVLLVSTPPMAAAFFGGTMGQFMSYAQVNGGGSVNRPGPQGQPPGSWGGFGPGAPATAPTQARPVESQAGNSGGFNRPITQAPAADTIRPYQSEGVRT
ncbi:type IV secretion system protein [Acidovorax sp. CCYZU-2555]|uniref:type IV secretion system protein n=1 Tax=Acidovorax sp. CCYZU-2555 TaxID=2835042 RepID=UPI001BCAAF06|nr:type IV secretion system protein [Acidovorax sp. CCYZU-2555]MBS7777355.1 type IV secretion system protein [Acidovorax sp. CCYZU-2555]